MDEAHDPLAPFALRNPSLPEERRGEAQAAVAAALGDEDAGLVGQLQGLQERLGHVPRDAILELSRRTGVPLARIYGVVTFYNRFHLEPRGDKIIRVCTGTACHVGGAPRITEGLASHLGVAPGHTTDDRRFTLETVACLGCCSLAPVMMVDEETHGRLTPERAVAVVREAELK